MNAADGINFRLHPTTIEFLQVDIFSSKIRSQIGPPGASGPPIFLPNPTKTYFFFATNTTELAPVVHLYFDAAALKTILGV